MAVLATVALDMEDLVMEDSVTVDGTLMVEYIITMAAGILVVVALQIMEEDLINLQLQ